MNQGKLEVVKRNGKSEHWYLVGKFSSNDCYICYCGQECFRRNGVALIVNKRFWNAVLGGNLKDDWTISVYFQGKSVNITVIQVNAPTSNAEEAEVEWLYDLQYILELITPLPPQKKDVLFIIRDWNAKAGSQEIPGGTGKFVLGVQNEAGQRLI